MTKNRVTEGAVIGPGASTVVSACNLNIACCGEPCARCGGESVEAPQGYDGFTFYYVNHTSSCAADPVVNEFSWLVNPGQRHNAMCKKIVRGPIWAKFYYNSMAEAGCDWVYCNIEKDDLDNLRAKIASQEVVKPSTPALVVCVELIAMTIGMFALFGLFPAPSPLAGPFLF